MAAVFSKAMTAQNIQNLENQKVDLPVPSYLPTKVYFGCGVAEMAVQVLGHLLQNSGCGRPVLITGHISQAKPWQKSIVESLAKVGVKIFENKVINPSFQSISRMLEQVRGVNGDCVIALGGGSVLDTGKVVSVLAGSSLTVEQALTDENSKFPVELPLLAMPTTCGTGAEVTPFATVWNTENKQKYSLSSPNIYPKVALVDPLLISSLPQRYVAGTGLDALAHGMESYWSVNSTTESREFGLEAVRLAKRYLKPLMDDRDNPYLMDRLALASLNAGFSIAGAQTTISHAISYPLTARYGVHHGHACGLSLGALLQFNAQTSDWDCQDERGCDFVRERILHLCDALDADDPATGERNILSLIESINLPTFDRFDVFDLSTIANDVMFYNRFKNNPRRMTRKQLEEFLNRLKRAKPQTTKTS